MSDRSISRAISSLTAHSSPIDIRPSPQYRRSRQVGDVSISEAGAAAIDKMQESAVILGRGIEAYNTLKAVDKEWEKKGYYFAYDFLF